MKVSSWLHNINTLNFPLNPLKMTIFIAFFATFLHFPAIFGRTTGRIQKIIFYKHPPENFWPPTSNRMSVSFPVLSKV